MPRIITEVARNQFNSSFFMLETLVEVCPDEVWYCYFYEDPFWYHIYHVAYFIDYWIRDDYSSNDFKSMAFDERIPPEFEYDVGPELSVSREEIKEYLKRLRDKTSCVFDSLDDERLTAPTTDGQQNFTYADVIMTQIRHIMYNIGYLNGILRSKDMQESDWYAYNEDE